MAGAVYHSDIKALDLSHNNVSHIAGGFFKPAELSLRQLFLGHNAIQVRVQNMKHINAGTDIHTIFPNSSPPLQNTTKNIFGNMPNLQWLDLSHNLIVEIDFDTFKNTRGLQVIQLAHNALADLPSDLFKFAHALRVVDMSHNHLKTVPDNLFPDQGLESFVFCGWCVVVCGSVFIYFALSRFSLAQPGSVAQSSDEDTGLVVDEHGGTVAVPVGPVPQQHCVDSQHGFVQQVSSMYYICCAEVQCTLRRGIA